MNNTPSSFAASHGLVSPFQTENNQGKFPVGVRHVATEIDGNHTEIIINTFASHVFIIVTQTDKMGTMIQASRDQGELDDGLSEPSFSMKVLIGKRENPLHVIYARQLIELISSTSAMYRPLLLGISLKGEDITSEQLHDPKIKSTFKQVMDIVQDNAIWQ
mmetsp:Transcript_3768/g.5260  ORF Transcript_3768/g.5260 Transcript_3768/m.5260 type:complete len:161 (-) Transcript_3768:5-487(-)